MKVKITAQIEIGDPKRALRELLEGIYCAHRLCEQDGKIGIIEEDHQGRPFFQAYGHKELRNVMELYSVLKGKKNG